MYLLYVDHSGEILNPSERYFVMGGIAIFERQIYHLEQKVEQIRRRYFSEQEEVEFHASVMRSRRKAPWKHLPKATVHEIMKEVYNAIALSHREGVVLFGVAIEKVRVIPNFETLSRELTERKRHLRRERERARGEAKATLQTELEALNMQIGRQLIAPVLDFSFARLSTAFENFLRRFFFHPEKDQQRGLMIFDHASYEDKLTLLMNSFKQYGTGFTEIKNIVDAPAFASSQASRLLQLADFVSHALFRRYEFGDAEFFDIIAPRFDQKDGIFYGLAHYTNDRLCTCPACLTRRAHKHHRRSSR